MAAMLGSKSLINKEVYVEALKLLHNTDKNNVPRFVRVLEQKEEYLASQMIEMARLLSSTHAQRYKDKHGIELSTKEISDLTLDFYITGWFNHIVLDKALDINWEKTWKEFNV